MHNTEHSYTLVVITLVSVALGYFAIQIATQDTMFGAAGPAATTMTQQVNLLSKAKIRVATLALN
jgi:hypothetical protein